VVREKKSSWGVSRPKSFIVFFFFLFPGLVHWMFGGTFLAMWFKKM